MTQSPTNADRAKWAKEALSVFTIRTYCGYEPDGLHEYQVETAIIELIADLLYFARQEGLKTAPILTKARRNFKAETAEGEQS